MARYKRTHLGDYEESQLYRVLRALEREDKPLLNTIWPFSQYNCSIFWRKKVVFCFFLFLWNLHSTFVLAWRKLNSLQRHVLVFWRKIHKYVLYSIKCQTKGFLFVEILFFIFVEFYFLVGFLLLLSLFFNFCCCCCCYLKLNLILMYKQFQATNNIFLFLHKLVVWKN